MSQIISSFSFSNIKNQIVRIGVTLGVSILVALGGAGFTVLSAKLTHNPIWKLANDPSEVMEFPPYIGMLSNWGVVLWVTAAAICLFSAVILKQQKASNATYRFIAASGGLSLVLGIDDLFVLHDHLLPQLLGSPERYFYFLYFFVFLVYLIYFLREIVKYEYLLFGAALVFFVLSRRIFVSLPFFDQFMTAGDMLKYFGIVFWLAFFYRTALFEVSAILNRKSSYA